MSWSLMAEASFNYLSYCKFINFELYYGKIAFVPMFENLLKGLDLLQNYRNVSYLNTISSLQNHTPGSYIVVT